MASLRLRTDVPPVTGPPPVRLSAAQRDATTDRARREGLTRTATLARLVEYALRTMPQGWSPDGDAA